MYRELYGDFADCCKGVKGEDWYPFYGKIFLWVEVMVLCIEQGFMSRN